MADDMTNKALGKFLSLEFLVLLVVSGIAWGTVTSTVADIEQDVQDHDVRHTIDVRELEAEQQKLNKEIGHVNRTLDVLENNQEHFKQRFDKVEADVDKMLEILQKQYPNGSGR